MKAFFLEHQSEIWATLSTLALLIALRFMLSKTIQRIGRVSGMVEARAVMITKYISVMLTFIGVGALAFIWSLDIEKVGLLFSSVFAVIGVALFASWSILSNITAGVILFFYFPFKIGDRVRIMDKEAESEGPYRIEDIKAFYVNLRKDNGELLVYPNNLMIQKAVALVVTDPLASEVPEAG